MNHTTQYPIRLDSQQSFGGNIVVVKIMLISDYLMFYIYCLLLVKIDFI